MHRSTYCNITSSNIISYIQMLTNPWDSTEGNVVSTRTYKTIKTVDETIFDLDMLYLQNGAVITSETIE